MTISNRVLVVEDNEIINNLLVRYLERYGFLPDSSCTYKDAVILLKRENYDLIVLDFKLDDCKSGLDLLPFVDKSTKIILLGHDNSHLNIADANKRVDEYIPKEFRGDELAIKARALLDVW